MAADPDVVAFYQEAGEAERLDADWFPSGRLEFARTKELLQRHFPRPPASVVDVGGANGRYAVWLRDLGYEIALVDPVTTHVTQASSAGLDARLGHAGNLDWDDETFDAVLLLGPLYHLVDGDDRASALHEARRVVRPGGMIAIAYINRFAGLFDLLTSGRADDPEIWHLVQGAMVTGVGPPHAAGLFTTAYFHHPDEIRPELVHAGLEVEAIYGVEGPGWLAPDLNDRWQNETSRHRLLDAARLVETEPTLAGHSAHLLAIAHRPASHR